MNLSDGIQSLSDVGLNLFSAIKISHLPEELQNIFKAYNKDTLCLVGSGGKSLWEHLPHPLNLDQNPIDNFSREQMNLFAKNYLGSDIEILFPHDSITLPLQKIGRAVNQSAQSPLGIDISPEYGLWFSFRGVFLTNNIPIDIINSSFSLPCNVCTDKPCTNSSEIKEARLLCPYKNEHQYTLSQRQYHENALSLLKFN